MANQSIINLAVSSNVIDGFTLAGGSGTKRNFVLSACDISFISGANISISANGTYSFVFPSKSDTLVGIGTSFTGDVTGSVSSNSVTGIRGIVVSSTTPTTTQVLTYDGTKYTPSGVLTNVIGICSMLVSTNGTVISVGTQTMQGDVTGGLTANSVTAIRGIVVNPVAPTATQVLTYDGTKYTASGVLTNVIGICSMLVSTNGTVISVGTQTMQGDVTGGLTANSVTAIRGIVVNPTAPTTNQVLMYDGTKYSPTGHISNIIGICSMLISTNGTVISVGAQSMQGDVTGSITASSVTAIRGIVVSPTAPTATQVLTYDGTKYTASGVLTNVIGICSMLVSTNGTVISVGTQTMQGDVTGGLTANSVIGIRGIVVASAVPTANQVLTYDGTKWTPSGVISNVVGVCSLLTSVVGSVIQVGTQNLQGDVTGSITASSVTGIRGIVVASAVPTTTQVLTYDGAKWTPSGVLTNVIGICSMLVSTNGTVISVGTQTMQGDVTGGLTSNSVTAIRGISVIATAPTLNQTLESDGTRWNVYTRGGDVTGSVTAQSVTGIRGIVVNSAAPTTNQVLMYDGTKYSPTGHISNIVGICSMLVSTNGTVISVGAQSMQGDVTGSITASSVTAIRGIVVSPTLPTVTQLLTYDGTKWTPSAAPVSVSTYVAMPSTLLIATGTTASTNNAYISSSSTINYLTLPSASTTGDTIRIVGRGSSMSGGWRIAQQTGQYIFYGSLSSTNGTAGYIESTHWRDCAELMCTSANFEWTVISAIGQINIV